MGSNCCKGDAAGGPLRSSSSIYTRSRAGASLDERFTASDDAGGVRLTVSAARTGDSGVYTLQASNEAGSDLARVRLEVSADEAPSGDDPPAFLRRLQDLTVKVGTRTRFLVEIVSSTECKVTWYRNERRLMEAERISLARDGHFWCADVSAVSVDDAGRWTCTAENAGGRASCSAHLNVLVPKAYKRPEFVEELRALLTEQGTVSLECKVVGVPTPVLRWFKDSREIKAGDVFALTANAEDPTSLGTYTCEAVNCMGRAYSSSKVHVVGRGSREGSAKPTSVTPEPPPIFTKELEPRAVRICEPLALGCQLVVPPWPRAVVWYNKEGKVEPSHRYHILEDGVGGYLMEVSSAEWCDEGEWKCVATSPGGRVGISTTYVTMDVPKNYRKPRFMENLQAVLTEEGLVSFECKVVGFPTPVLSWFKDGQELKPGDVYQLTGTNSLGSYCCIARNCMGRASSSAELTVEDIQNQLNEEEKLQLFSKNQAPKFVSGLKSVEARIDEPFRFTIKVQIPPEPSVMWYRDDQPIDESTRCHLGKEDKGLFFLDIQNLELLDQAEWKCVAMNDYGHSVTSCFLKLLIPRHYKKPRFLENLQAILSDEGAVNLECKVIGVPQPILKWYKDGEELKPGDIHRIISGQDGTCCLGTYTCEAQNCMGIAASSASLLGFDESIKAKKKKTEEQILQRNLSLSTIHEERTSQMYDTPVGDITLDDKGEISFSFDGKEVSVSLYETPDLTEEEALQIVEMYADQLSENVTEHNVVELPPLRFVKETSTSGNLLMEAIIIDVSPDYFVSPEEDLRTEADVEDISIADENAVPQLSLDTDLGGEDYLEKTMALLSEEKSDVSKKMLRKKSDSVKSGEDFFSLSREQSLSEDKRDDDTQVSESFASARSSAKMKSKSTKPSEKEGKASSDVTKTIVFKEEAQKHAAEPEPSPVVKPKRERRSSRGSRRSSSGSDKSLSRSRDEPRKKPEPEKEKVEPKLLPKPELTNEEFKNKMINASVSLSKVINDVQVIERDIILKSELMSSAATASRSLEIINSLITPLSEIHSIADAVKESAPESKEVSGSLFSNLPQPLKALQQTLTIIQKCIDVESDSKTLVKRTCVAFIQTCGNEMQKLMIELNSVTSKLYLSTDEKTLSDIDVLTKEVSSVLKDSVETVKTKNLVVETSESKTEEASHETKHLRDTQKAVFELRNPLNSLLCIAGSAESSQIHVAKVKHSDVILTEMSASIQDLQAALEQIESLSVKESTTSLHKYNTDIIETVMDSVLKLRSSFEQLSTEARSEEDKTVLKQALASIKHNLSEISSHIDTIEQNVGTFDVLQSDNKLEVLQKMAQILIALENNLPRLEVIPEVKTHLDGFHKNLTKVLENVIESNDAKKYFTLIEICDAVNRVNSSIKNIETDNMLALASLSNTIKIIQEYFVNNVFESELNCSILSNIADVLVGIEEAVNHADEISMQIDSEHIQDILTQAYEGVQAQTILQQIDQTIAAVSKVKSLETTKELKLALTPVLETISPVLEELKRSVASARPSGVEQDEHVSEISEMSLAQTLATPICELNQNIVVLNQMIVENIDSIKDTSEIIATIAEPLHELHTTLEVLQQVVISQYGDDIATCDVSVNMASMVQNLQSCIVMIQEQAGVEPIDEMSTLEDISGIKTTADAIPLDHLILPTAEETKVEQGLFTFNQELSASVTAHVLQSLNEHITVLQCPEILDALDSLSEVSDFSSLKSVALGLGDLHAGIEEILHPIVMESSRELGNLINASKLTAIAEPMQELQQSLSILDTSNIPIYEHILEIPAERIHSVLKTVTEFREQLDKCIKAVFPAMETADKTIEISNKVETLREVCEHLKDIFTTVVSQDVSVKQDIIALQQTVENLLNATDVSKGIKIDNVKTITEELYQNIVTVQEEIIQFIPHTHERLSQEALMIQAIDEIENNIAVLEQYEFVDLSRASDITSCTSPQLAMELESESLLQMDDIVENAVNVVQDSTQDTPIADLMIIEDFFKTCKNEFTILRCLMNKQLSHKKIIRILQEFASLQSSINEFRHKRGKLKLSSDIDSYLTTFLIHADDCLQNVQESLVKIVQSQSEVLIKQPLKKLEETKKALKQIPEGKISPQIAEVAKKFGEVIDATKPCTKNAEKAIIEELKDNSSLSSKVHEKHLTEKMEEVTAFLEQQSNLQSLDDDSKQILQKVLTCIQKHDDYRDAMGTGKVLIILKCLSECSDVLQESLLDIKPKTVVEPKIEDNALKAVLTEMLVPLQALHSQLVNVQEQILSGANEDTISVDIPSTESFVQTMSEIHKEIQQVESGKLAVDSEEISLIMDVDKKIHTIQDSIRSMENVPAAQVVKEISKPIDDIEKSLHNLLSSEKVLESKGKLPADVNSNIDSLESALERFINIEIDLMATLVLADIDVKESIQIAINLKQLLALLTEAKSLSLETAKLEKVTLLEKILTKFDWLNTDKYLEGKNTLETEKLNRVFLTTYQLLAELNQVSQTKLKYEAKKEKAAQLIQHIDQYIELIEIVEEISAVIKIENLKETANIAREFRDTITASESSADVQSRKSNDIEISSEQVNMAYKLQKAVSAFQVQVLDSAQELAPALGVNVLQRIAQITAQLQADLVAVTGIQVAVQAPADFLSEVTKSLKESLSLDTVQQDLDESQVAFTETHEAVVMKKKKIDKGFDYRTEDAATKELTEKTVAESQQEIIHEVNDLLSQENINNAAQVTSNVQLVSVGKAGEVVVVETDVLPDIPTISPEEKSQPEKADVKVEELQIISEQVKIIEKHEATAHERAMETLKQHIEVYTSKDVVEVIEKISELTNFDELKQSIKVAQELSESITVTETGTEGETSVLSCEIQEQQAQIVQQLQTALNEFRTIILTGAAELTVIEHDSLQKVIKVAKQIQDDLQAVVKIEELTSLAEPMEEVAYVDESAQAKKTDVVDESTAVIISEVLESETAKPLKKPEIIEKAIESTISVEMAHVISQDIEVIGETFAESIQEKMKITETRPIVLEETEIKEKLENAKSQDIIDFATAVEVTQTLTSEEVEVLESKELDKENISESTSKALIVATTSEMQVISPTPGDLTVEKLVTDVETAAASEADRLIEIDAVAVQAPVIDTLTKDTNTETIFEDQMIKQNEVNLVSVTEEISVDFSLELSKETSEVNFEANEAAVLVDIGNRDKNYVEQLKEIVQEHSKETINDELFVFEQEVNQSSIEGSKKIVDDHKQNRIEVDSEIILTNDNEMATEILEANKFNQQTSLKETESSRRIYAENVLEINEVTAESQEVILLEVEKTATALPKHTEIALEIKEETLQEAIKTRAETQVLDDSFEAADVMQITLFHKNIEPQKGIILQDDVNEVKLTEQLKVEGKNIKQIAMDESIGTSESKQSSPTEKVEPVAVQAVAIKDLDIISVEGDVIDDCLEIFDLKPLQKQAEIKVQNAIILKDEVNKVKLAEQPAIERDDSQQITLDELMGATENIQSCTVDHFEPDVSVAIEKTAEVSSEGKVFDDSLEILDFVQPQQIQEEIEPQRAVIQEDDVNAVMIMEQSTIKIEKIHHKHSVEIATSESLQSPKAEEIHTFVRQIVAINETADASSVGKASDNSLEKSTGKESQQIEEDEKAPKAVVQEVHVTADRIKEQSTIKTEETQQKTAVEIAASESLQSSITDEIQALVGQIVVIKETADVSSKGKVSDNSLEKTAVNESQQIEDHKKSHKGVVQQVDVTADKITEQSTIETEETPQLINACKSLQSSTAEEIKPFVKQIGAVEETSLDEKVLEDCLAIKQLPQIDEEKESQRDVILQDNMTEVGIMTQTIIESQEESQQKVAVELITTSEYLVEEIQPFMEQNINTEDTVAVISEGTELVATLDAVKITDEKSFVGENKDEDCVQDTYTTHATDMADNALVKESLEGQLSDNTHNLNDDNDGHLLVGEQMLSEIGLEQSIIEISEIELKVKESIADERTLDNETVVTEIVMLKDDTVSEHATENNVKDNKVMSQTVEVILLGTELQNEIENPKKQEVNLDICNDNQLTVMDNLKIAKENSALSTEHAGLIQHIEDFISCQITEKVGDLSTIEQLKESVGIAQELRETIAAVDILAASEDTVLVAEEAKIEEAKLAQKLQDSLCTLQMQVLGSAQEIAAPKDAESIKRVSEVVTHLQEDLKSAFVNAVKDEIKTEPEIPQDVAKQSSMKDLEDLLQIVNKKINVTSMDQTPEDTEELKDTLGEVQTVIIKLKRDCDGAGNDTLNETLEDLECSVRSVQLQINENSPPELVKEACATLQPLANNMTNINDVHLHETIVKQVKTDDVLEKCSTEANETVKLLDAASKLETKGTGQLKNIVACLSNLKDILKTLRESFLNDADTLIEKGVEVLQNLNLVEDKVFSLEKDVDYESNLELSLKENIISAVHSVYGSISNMRSTISSIQKQYMYENYGKPSESLLRSIKNISTFLAEENKVVDKSDWKKVSKSLRNTLNHFEDVKFYINLDKTARLPSDAAFTKIILEELKSNIAEIILPFTNNFDPGLSIKSKEVLQSVHRTLNILEPRATLEVKEKIPIFKDIATQFLNLTEGIKSKFEESKDDSIQNQEKQQEEIETPKKIPERVKEKPKDELAEPKPSTSKDVMETRPEYKTVDEEKLQTIEKQDDEVKGKGIKKRDSKKKREEERRKQEEQAKINEEAERVKRFKDEENRIQEIQKFESQKDDKEDRLEKEKDVNVHLELEKEVAKELGLEEKQVEENRLKDKKEENEAKINRVKEEKVEKLHPQKEKETEELCQKEKVTEEVRLQKKKNEEVKLNEEQELQLNKEKVTEEANYKTEKDVEQAIIKEEKKTKEVKKANEELDVRLKEEKVAEKAHLKQTKESEKAPSNKQKEEQKEHLKSEETGEEARLKEEKETAESRLEKEIEVDEDRIKNEQLLMQKEKEFEEELLKKERLEEKAHLKKVKEARLKKEKEDEEAGLRKEKEDEEALLKKQQDEQLRLNKEKEAEEARIKKEKEKEDTRLYKEQEEQVKKKETEDVCLQKEEEARLKKEKEAEEARINEEQEKQLRIQTEKETDEERLKREKLEEEVRLENQKVSEVSHLKKEKEQEEQLRLKKEKEAEEARLKKEEEARLKKEKKDEQARLKKEQDEQMCIKKEKEAEEACLKKDKDEEDARFNKEQELQLRLKKEKDAEEARLKKEKEEEEARFKKEQIELLRLKKEKEAEEVRLNKEKEEEEARLKKEQEEQLRLKKEKDVEEARLKKEQEEKETRLKKEKQDEEARLKKEQDEKLRIKKEKETEEACLKKEKEEKDARLNKEQEEQLRPKNEKDAEEARLKKEKEEEEARLKKEQEEQMRLEKEKEAEEARLKKEKEEEEARLKKEQEEQLRLKKEKDVEEARLKKEQEEKETRLKKKKQDEEARLKKEQYEKLRIKKEKEAEEACLKKEKEEEDVRLNKEQEEQLRLKEEKKGEEARLKKEKAEEEARLKKEQEEQLRLKKEKEAEEARLKKEKEEEKARLKKEQEEQLRLKKEKDVQEARLKKEQEEKETRLKKEKQDEEARLKKEQDEKLSIKKEKEAEEACLKKEKEEKDSRLNKELEEQLRLKNEKDAEEARLKKEKEEEEARLKKEQEEQLRLEKEKEAEEARLKKKKEEEEARLKKEQEEQLRLKKEKDVEEARLKKEQEEKETRLKKDKQDEEARLKKEQDEKLRIKKEKEAEEACLKKEKEEEDARLNKEQEEQLRLKEETKAEEARLKKEKAEEEARLMKEQEEQLRLKKEKEAEEARLKKEKEEEEARRKTEQEEQLRLQKEKEAEEARVKKEKEEEEARLQKEKEAEESRVKKEKEEQLHLKKEKEAEEARLKKEKEEEEARLKKEQEEQLLLKREKEAKEARLKKKKEEEEARLQKDKEAEESRVKKEKEEQLHLEKEKEAEEARLRKGKEEEEAHLKKEQDEELRLNKEKEAKQARLKKEKEDEKARLKIEQEEQLRLKKEKEEEESRLRKEQDEQLHLKKEKEAEEARLKKEKKETEARLKNEKEEEEARVKNEQEEQLHLKKGKKAEEAHVKKEKEAEETRLKQEKQNELALVKKEKEAEEARVNKEKEAEEARVKKEKETEEARLKKEKEAEEAQLKKEKEAKEARVKKDKEAEEARLIKEKEVEDLRFKKEEIACVKEAKNVNEANPKKEKEDEEVLLKKEKEEELRLKKEKQIEETRLKKEKECKDEHFLKEKKEIYSHSKKEKEAQKAFMRKEQVVQMLENDIPKQNGERSKLRRRSKESVTIDTSRRSQDEVKTALQGSFDQTQTISDTQVYTAEYDSPTSCRKFDDKEKPRFVDHNHRDFTMEFARPSGYRERSFDDKSILERDSYGRSPLIYKAQTIVLDSQLRSSFPPVPEVSHRSESERRSEVRQRSIAISEARSIVSEKRSSVPRDVKRKPVFSTYLTDRTAVEGSRVKLTCSVLCSGDPTITWYKNGVVLDKKLKYRTKLVDGLITLEVLNAVPSDSAEYSCTVENENGSVSSSANLKVYPSFEASPIPPTFTRSIRDTYHLAENELVLECRIRGQPLPSITWLKDDKVISTNERYQAYYLADGVCRLAINHPTPDDSGKYTCKAENSVWSDQINHVVNFTGHESRLSPNIATIERSRFNRAAIESRRPHFGNVLTDYKVPKGGTIGLQVEIRGCPTRVEWLREGRSVTDVYGNARTFVEQGLYTLALADVTEKESGMYTCRAWSTHGTVDMNAAITVVQPNELEGRPAIIVGRPEKDVLISVGEDLNISFRVQGEPKPKVIFMKGIRDITNSQRVCKMTSDDYVKFTVKRSVISDAGTYCILARNAYGCDRAFVTVVIRQRESSDNLISDWTYPSDNVALDMADRQFKAVPERIPGEPSVVDCGANWVSIAWPKPEARGAAPVLAYRVDSWLLGKEGGARWLELGITPLNSFDAFNLKQGEKYHFRVTPRNRYGWGEAVQTSTPVAVGLAGDRPEFVDILPGQLKVLVGQTAHLSCSVKGKPTPAVVWMKNGHEVDEDARIKTSFNGYNCSITIVGITAEDEARYSCEATNAHGRASTYARLAVVTDRMVWEADAKLKRERSEEAEGDFPPQFTMRLRDRRVQATYPVRLTCQVVGSPAPTLTWFKDGQLVHLDSRRIASQDEHFHTLEIAPTTLEDGGMYEALARNTSGAVSCRCCLVVDKGIRAYVAPEFCCGLEPLYRLFENEELRISAVVEAYPSVGVTWYRDGVRLRTSRRAVMTLDRDGQIELALASVTPRDAGVYTCTASNEVGTASTSGKVEVIGDEHAVKKRSPPMVVSPDVPYSKEPMFTRKPRSSEAREGDTVIIVCEVIGDPKPDVYWLRDFLKPDYYRDATHFKRVGAGPEYRFEIPHAKLDYTGAYSVVAKNVHGEAKAIISLQILAKDPTSSEEHNVRYGRVEVIPRFEKNLTDLLSYDGDAVEFECRVSGHPEPDIRWFHYTEIIRDCTDFETSYEDGTARLKIKQVTADDEGTYACEASNTLGKASSTACLVVYPPGEPNTLSQRLRRPPALLSAASTPRSTPRSTPARSVSRTPGPDCRRVCSPSRQMAPKFYTYPYNKVAEEGDTVVLQCAARGLPVPWTTWDKDGVVIKPSSRITIKEKDDMMRILEIEQVSVEDVGLYRVTLENDYGRVEACARLEVITREGRFHAGVRSYSASPRRARRHSASRQD